MGTWGDRPTRGTAEGAPTGLRHQQHCRLFATRPLACLCFPSTPVTSRYLGERHRGWEKAERRVDVARTGGMAPFHSRDGRCCSWSAQSCSFQGSSPQTVSARCWWGLGTCCQPMWGAHSLKAPWANLRPTEACIWSPLTAEVHSPRCVPLSDGECPAGSRPRSHPMEEMPHP